MSAASYQKIRVLGKGSFGSAWLVKRVKDGQSFVAKEVRLANMKPGEREEAKNEISTLRKLEHPNITRYVDHYESAGSLFIVMEYANGGDLYTKIQSRRGVRFSEREVLHYFVQLALALYHMHEKRILHRDLKTQNVFLTADGVIKLGDFGISTVLRSTYELKRTVCGTPYYFSPELCQNKPYNNKSDIWALGCILYELTTLNHAFDGSSMKALVQRILRGVYPPIPTSYSKELRDLIAGMLHLDPHKRPHIAQIVQLPFIRTAMESLQKEVRTANAEKRSCVDEAQRQKEKLEAARRAEQERAQRAEAERVARAKRDAEKKADAARREDQMAKLRQQMEREVRQHEENLQRIREQRKVEDEKRKAQAAEREKRMEEERRARAKRQAERDAENRKREEEWERNMRAARDEADERRRAAADAQQRDHAEAYKQARAQAKANQQRAEEAERREREERARVYHADNEPAPPAPKPQENYDPRGARDLYFQNRREAAMNRQRAQDDQKRDQAPPAPAMSEPSEAPPQGKRAPTPQDEQAQAQQRANAFWEMRRAAEENKRRLMGLDASPSPAGPPVEEAGPSRPPLVPPAVAARDVQSAPVQHRVAPQAPERVQSAPEPPARRAPTPPAEEDDEMPSDPDDADGDIGFHKFINNDAAADDGAHHNESRQKDYKGVEDDISRLLSDPNQGRVLEDFSDAAPTDPTHFVLDGRTLHLPNTTPGDPLGHRIETLRMFLEDVLGDESFFSIYRLLSRSGEQDDATAEAARIAGPEKERYIEVVTQLIVCEEAFANGYNK